MILGSRAIEMLPGRRTRARKLVDPLLCEGIIVPVGYVSDGASIPRPAWTLIGHPFEGRFIRPSFLHDIRCEFRIGTWQETHEQFLATLEYEAVRRIRRHAMYRAVWLFGPRWPRHQSRTHDDLLEIVSRAEGPNGLPWGVYPERARAA